jgi:hypothetical protein
MLYKDLFLRPGAEANPQLAKRDTHVFPNLLQCLPGGLRHLAPVSCTSH